ncbi:hypothetical protein D3C72_2423110 [compost metagenome]
MFRRRERRASPEVGGGGGLERDVVFQIPAAMVFDPLWWRLKLFSFRWGGDLVLFWFLTFCLG